MRPGLGGNGAFSLSRWTVGGYYPVADLWTDQHLKAVGNHNESPVRTRAWRIDFHPSFMQARHS